MTASPAGLTTTNVAVGGADVVVTQDDGNELSGSFTFTFGAGTSGAIQFGATANEVKDAL